MTMCFKTHEAKSKHQVEGVNPYISANYVTCGCFGIYASPEEMKWSCGEAMWTKNDTQSVSLNTEVCDELLDWAVGDRAEPFTRPYAVHSMIGTMNYKCSATFLNNGALAITSEIVFNGKETRTWRKFMGGPSTLVIFLDDLINAVIDCHDMVINDWAYSRAWLDMPLEVRQRHMSKNETEADKKLWQEEWLAACLWAEGKKLDNRERWALR